MYNDFMLPLLLTKTSIPALRTNRVERARLAERIGEGVKRALTLVVAPAGFGKTTLITGWARSTSMPVAWLSLELADRAPERFLSYLVHALQQISPQTGQTALAILHGGQPVIGDAILFSLLNDLSELPGETAVVLDDYHSVDGPEVNPIVQSLLEHLPAQVHLVLLSRSMPGLSLARLRALDQVVEVYAADLRFSDAESHSFLEQMGASLRPGQLERLNQSTEGWAVGLQLAGLALAHQPFDWNIPAGQAHIFEYLAEEVLRREPPEVQEFLKVSALFDRFCAPMLDCIWRGMDHNTSNSAANLLSHVERANLFLIPLDPAGIWYRYHALFAEFLRRQLPTGRSKEYYRAASDWFEESHYLDEAIFYATRAGQHERAAGLLETHYLDLVQRGEQSALVEWLAALPQEVLERRPRLWLAKGWASIISMNSTEADVCAEKAEALILPGETQDAMRLRGEAKSLRILTGIFAGKSAAADEISDTFILLAEQDDLLHTLLHFNLGLHHVMLGNTALALDSFAETLRLTRTQNNPLVSIVAQVQTGEVRQMRGALGLAERSFKQVIQYARQTLGERTFLLGMPYVSYADLLREQNRFEESIRYAEQGIAYCEVWQPAASMDGRIALARLKAAQGRWEDAYAQLEHALQVAETSASLLDDTFVAIQLVRLHLLQGNVPRAEHLIKLYDMENAATGMYYHLWEMTQLTLLRAQIASLQSAPLRASGLLDALSRLVAGSERRERVTSVIEASILQAYAYHIISDHNRARQSLSHALTLGAQSGYVRIFVDEGKTLLRLLEQMRHELHAPHAYMEEILNILRREVSEPKTAIRAHTGGLTPLTRRELDILRLLAAGKSNQEIATEYVLTLNTVKKHVGNILSKMGVANRTQAVMLAKKLGWLE